MFDKNEFILKIKEGEVKMKPRWIFVAKVFGLIVLSILVFCLAVLIVGFLMFLISQNNFEMVESVKLMNLRMIFNSLPWVIILLSLILIGLFELVLKRIVPIYRKPVLLVLLSIILFSTFVGFGITKTGLYKNMCNCNDWRGRVFSYFKSRYKQYVFEGKILMIDKSGKTLVEIGNGETVVLNRDQYCSHCLMNMQIGSIVLVSGEKVDNQFKPLKLHLKSMGMDNSMCSKCSIKMK